MKLIYSTLLLATMGLANSVRAADFQCYEFTQNETGIPKIPMVPAIVTYRSDTDGVTLSQEIIALNEEVDNALTGFRPHDRVCLKGRRGYGNTAKFFAYAVQAK